VSGPAAFTFSPDDCLFAVADGQVIRLWELASKKEIGSIRNRDDGSKTASLGAVRTIAFAPDGRTLATGHADSTILLWDATLRGGQRAGALTGTEVEALWSDLAGADAPRAYAAIWRLVDDPERSLPLLKEHVKPVAPADEALRAVLNDLDSDQFKTREAAAVKLQKLGEQIEGALRESLATNPSLEKRRRIEAVLTRLDPAVPLTGETLRAMRAIQVLERIGSQEARKTLELLAHGVASARLTRAAQEALKRLAGPAQEQ
jgi:hypothetical protein